MRLVRVDGLPDAPLAAAAHFHASGLPDAAEDILLVFPPADHRHRGWRLAAVQELARAAAPRRRVNALAGGDAVAIAAAAAFLAGAPGVTGQLLVLDSQGAGDVVGSTS